MSAPAAIGHSAVAARRGGAADTEEASFALGNLRCGGCVASVERILVRAPGIVHARANLTSRRTLALQLGEATHLVHVDYTRAGLVIEHAGVSSAASGSVDGKKVRLQWNGATIVANVTRIREGTAVTHEKLYTFMGGRRFDIELHDPLVESETGEDEAGGLTAPMPGKILAVLAKAGSVVDKGAPLVVMEAMKMEHTIFAPARGRVTELLHAVGDQVAEGATLIGFEAEAAKPA